MPTKTATNITYSKPTTNAYDLSVIGSEQHAQLSALFKAIADSINDECSQTKELALLGKYLCDDWGNLFNSEEEAHKHRPAIDSQPCPAIQAMIQIRPRQALTLAISLS